jgi:hypothetical protein
MAVTPRVDHPQRQPGGNKKQNCLGGKDAGKGKIRRKHKPQCIDGNRAHKAADPGGNGLRRAPKPHPGAFPVGPALPESLAGDHHDRPAVL